MIIIEIYNNSYLFNSIFCLVSNLSNNINNERILNRIS